MTASTGQVAVISDRRRSRDRAASSFVGHLIATPATVALLLLFVAPTLAVFFIAMTNWQLGGESLSFVGLENFRSLFRDHDFYVSLTNTLVYGLIVVPATVGLGLLVALLIESQRSLRTFYRAAQFLPFMATMAAMAIAWEALLHPTAGLVNQVLASWGLPTANWLRDSRTVLPTLAVIGIWQNFGYSMVLFLAGLKAIPQDLYDAAEIDGAHTTFDRLRTVTLPLLGPTTMFVTIVVGLRALEVFDTVKILTKGEPAKASEVLLHTLYVESFEYLHTGYGAAIAVVFLGLVASLTLIQARIMDRRIHYS
jgi:multiple sugar transport system permease protein